MPSTGFQYFNVAQDAGAFQQPWSDLARLLSDLGPAINVVDDKSELGPRSIILSDFSARGTIPAGSTIDGVEFRVTIGGNSNTLLINLIYTTALSNLPVLKNKGWIQTLAESDLNYMTGLTNFETNTWGSSTYILFQNVPADYWSNYNADLISADFAVAMTFDFDSSAENYELEVQNPLMNLHYTPPVGGGGSNLLLMGID